MSLHELTSVYLSFRARLARAVSRIVPPKDVEDIVQEAYVRLCRAENLPATEHVRSYLLKTVRNLAIDHAKSAQARLSVPFDDEPDTISGPEWQVDETYAQVASDEEFGLFCEAVRHLPVQCRRAFVLKKVYGYSQREIAVELGLTESTVEKHIALGIRRCAHFMARHQFESTSRVASPRDARLKQGFKRD